MAANQPPHLIFLDIFTFQKYSLYYYIYNPFYKDIFIQLFLHHPNTIATFTKEFFLLTSFAMVPQAPPFATTSFEAKPRNYFACFSKCDFPPVSIETSLLDLDTCHLVQ